MSVLDDIPFIEARWFTNVTVTRDIRYVVIHDMEMPEKPDTAEACARMFANLGPDRKASAHYSVDNNSIVQSVRDNDIAYGAPPNTHSLHVEHAGFASQSRAQWLDPYGLDMLNNSARLVAARCRKFDLPIAFLSPQDLRDDKEGITTHANVSKAFGQTTHTDPGPDFPIGLYLDLVRQFSTQEEPLTPADIDQIADAVADKLLTGRIDAFVDRVRRGVQGELGDENAGVLSDRITAKVVAALPAVVNNATVDYEVLATKVADKLAARLAQ